MSGLHSFGLVAVAALAVLFAGERASAQQARPEPALACGHFTQDQLPAPEPREAASAKKRFEEINAAVKTQPYRVIFFGDSLTERFETWDAPDLWRQHMAARGVLNAGVNGDRTEHLLWRLDHGNLDGPTPLGMVLLIGTNDLGHGRSVEDTAEGIRANLVRLREKAPGARILLLGLWPRGGDPDSKFREPIREVNNRVRTCGDDRTVFYADIGGVLLDPDGRLSKAISPDLLHFNRAGYERLVPKLDPLVNRLLAGR
ncbi:MAG TPA: GDSL-type esterase/lipase family protein [Stellaceae bacterium]